MLHRKNHLLLLLTSTCLLSTFCGSASADQNAHKIQSLTITQVEAPQEEEEEEEEEAKEPVTNTKPYIDPPTIAPTKDFYLPLENAVTEPNIRVFTPADTPFSIPKKIKAFDKQLASLPPTILFHAANALMAKGFKEKAATYYVLADLRKNFDKRRFVTDETSAGFLAQEKMKQTAYYRIQPWLSESSDRMAAIYDKVKYIDFITPVHYHPGYSIEEEADIATWPKLHEETRQNYFKEFEKYRSQMNQYAPKQ